VAGGCRRLPLLGRALANPLPIENASLDAFIIAMKPATSLMLESALTVRAR
jgi:hypothetical protein